MISRSSEPFSFAAKESTTPPQEDCKCNQSLIIDDNMFNIMSIQMLLSKVKSIPKGADKALDGNQGLAQMKKKLELCCKKPYRFIVVDLNMPHLDGVSMM